MRSKLLVIALLLVTAAYCWGLMWIAWGFSRAGGVVGWGLAGAVAVLLILSVGVIWREVLFGLATSRLATQYAERSSAGRDGFESTDGEDPTAPTAADDDPTDDPAGDVEPAARRRSRKDAARAEFDRARRAVQDGGEDDWRAWYRLAHAYDANRDRAHGRACARTAIRLERAERTATAGALNRRA